MEDTRIVVQNKKGQIEDIKYKIEIKAINTYDEVIEFYGKFGFTLEKAENKSGSNKQTLFYSKTKLGYIPIRIGSTWNNTIFTFKRELPEKFDTTFEDTFFESLKKNIEDLDKIYQKYNFWIIFFGILLWTIYAIIPFSILKTKRSNRINNNKKELTSIMNSLEDYKIDNSEKTEIDSFGFNTSNFNLDNALYFYYSIHLKKDEVSVLVQQYVSSKENIEILEIMNNKGIPPALAFSLIKAKELQKYSDYFEDDEFKKYFGKLFGALFYKLGYEKNKEIKTHYLLNNASLFSK